jgi:hypothetical protein
MPYMAGLVAVTVSPYKNGPFDPHVKGVAEYAANEVFNNLKKLKNEPPQSQARGLVPRGPTNCAQASRGR